MAVKKRRHDEAGGSQLPGSMHGNGGGDPSAGEDNKDARIAELEGTLQHLRSWMAALAAQVQRMPAHDEGAFNARRLFIGGVPDAVTEDELRSFLNEAITKSGAAVSARGQPVLFCRIQRDRGVASQPASYAFVEVRSAEEASNVMALDGILLNGVTALKVKRPTKWEPMTAMMLGPTQPDPTVDVSRLPMAAPRQPPPAAAAAAPGGGGTVAGGGGMAGAGAGAAAAGGGGGIAVNGSRGYAQNWNTLYIGGLPMDWSVEQCLELLGVYGDVKHFKLMTDRNTGASRGFAFAEYATDEQTVVALQALDGAILGPRRIAANRILEHKQREQMQRQQEAQRYREAHLASTVQQGQQVVAGYGGYDAVQAGGGGGYMQQQQQQTVPGIDSGGSYAAGSYASGHYGVDGAVAAAQQQGVNIHLQMQPLQQPPALAYHQQQQQPGMAYAQQGPHSTGMYSSTGQPQSLPPAAAAQPAMGAGMQLGMQAGSAMASQQQQQFAAGAAGQLTGLAVSGAPSTGGGVLPSVGAWPQQPLQQEHWMPAASQQQVQQPWG